MLRICVGLLILLLMSGCSSTPAYPTFIQETREETARDLCNEYVWGQANRWAKTAVPSASDICLALHLCAMKSMCILELPKWHYKKPRRF